MPSPRSRCLCSRRPAHRLRLVLLLLLALLLPLRGAMAAAMLCPVGAQGPVAPADAPHGHSMTQADDDEEVSEAPMEHDHGGHHAAGAAERCDLCAACCSISPAAGGVPPLPAPGEAVEAGFPPLRVPVPDFLSDGPERPPRSR